MKSKLVYGVGINDADYQVSVRMNGKQWRCHYYVTWKNMLARCYSEAYLKQDQSRIGSSVHPDWHSFIQFKEWMKHQDWEGNVLDKDLLVKGNKNYGPDTSVFISPMLNSFLGKRSRNGVYKVANGNKWNTAIVSPTGRICKYFSTKEEAEKEYNELYKNTVIEIAQLQTNPLIQSAVLELIRPS